MQVKVCKNPHKMFIFLDEFELMRVCTMLDLFVMV